MKVIVKKPNMQPAVCEVKDIVEINKIVGNVDKDGNGYNHAGTDIRMFIGENIDMYIKEDAINNFELEENLWTPNDRAVIFGNAVFAGYDYKRLDNKVCSLTDEQIGFCMSFIAKQTI